MGAASFPEDLAQYFHQQGWQTNRHQVSEGVVIVTGSQHAADKEIQMVAMVILPDAEPIDASHLRYLLKAKEQKDADTVFLSALHDISEEVRQACREHQIEMLDPDVVQEVQSSDASEAKDMASDSAVTQAQGAQRSNQPAAHMNNTADQTKTSTMTRRQMLIAGGVGTAVLGGGAFSVISGQSDINSLNPLTGSDSNAGVDGGEDGFLQSSAEETGQESQQEVSTRLEEVIAIGTVTDNQITEVKITVELAPGAADIDLDKATARWNGPANVRDLVATGATGVSDADGVFSYDVAQDDDGSVSSNGTLNSISDRAAVIIGIDGSSAGDLNAKLNAGQTAVVELNPESGSKLRVKIVVPDPLSDQETVTLSPGQ